MADCDDPFGCALREVTRRFGPAIWGEPGRFRSRLHYEMASVTAEQNPVLDAVVIAAIHGIPRSILDREDLQPRMRSLCDLVEPLHAVEAVAAWTRALTELELVPAPEPARATRVPSLMDKLRPPPPVSV